MASCAQWDPSGGVRGGCRKGTPEAGEKEVLVGEGLPGPVDGRRCEHGQLLGLLSELCRQVLRTEPSAWDGQDAQPRAKDL